MGGLLHKLIRRRNLANKDLFCTSSGGDRIYESRRCRGFSAARRDGNLSKTSTPQKGKKYKKYHRDVFLLLTHTLSFANSRIWSYEMGSSENWPVPTRETYEWVVYLFSFFPVVDPSPLIRNSGKHLTDLIDNFTSMDSLYATFIRNGQDIQ